MIEIKEQLKREEQMMGRPVKYRNAWESVFRGTDGRERKFRVIIYDVEPHEVAGFAMHETRYVVQDDSGKTGGGIIEAGETEEP